MPVDELELVEIEKRLNERIDQMEKNTRTTLESELAAVKTELMDLIATTRAEIENAITSMESLANTAQAAATAAQNTANQARAGELKALNVAEKGAAIVRCHDFRMGTSNRSGKVGRALVDGTDNLILNYGPDWEGGTIVHGELKARLWFSDEYVWHQGEPDVRMMPAADTVAFLTRVQGSFRGGGEVVGVYVKDGYWYLGGRSMSNGVQASARCIGRP